MSTLKQFSTTDAQSDLAMPLTDPDERKKYTSGKNEFIKKVVK